MASVQMTNGKAFEYALLQALYRRLSPTTKIDVFENDTYAVAERCYLILSGKDQQASDLNASFATNFLIDLEPRLEAAQDGSDVLTLELLPDAKGKKATCAMS